ncbi:hypothetical protein GCM10025864_31320 [Luteimicrobium album]|uniref:Large ribosomal subunit protein bL28 n=1 Tax=Luteimicrobium album TaxID=1054550 RepID=A0ABQ6I5Y6_9MICO|nr:hypothetical protein GCM10025864_31320 [Luteimicrobium album]
MRVPAGTTRQGLGRTPIVGYHIEVAWRRRATAARVDDPSGSGTPRVRTFDHSSPGRGSGVHDDQEQTVAANCDVCGKGPGFGHSISHSHVRTKRRWNPNIQRVRAIVGAPPSA